jgi:DnaJ like chaperone protein
MTRIGRIIVGARQWSLGGPLGRLVGHAAHWLPQSLARRLGTSRSPDPRGSLAFTIAVIALGAKMAKADGSVTRDEVAAFREVFQVPPEEEAHLRRVFDIARRSTAGFEIYARQVGRLFARRREDLQDLLGGLFYIALADGRICPAEEAYLRDVARYLGFSAAEYDCLRASFGAAPPEGGTRSADDPHEVLGVPIDASVEEIRAAYRRLMRAHHPDLLAGSGISAHQRRLAAERAARINAARDRLLRQRRTDRLGAQPA